MFLEHCSGTDEDHTTDFGSLESVSSAEILADDPAAPPGAPGLEGSSEQLLWRRWALRSSGSPRSASRPPGEAAAPSGAETSRSPSVLQPPSPLDAGGVGQEIRSWMENAAAAGGSHPSLSSEEGIYSLPALDSDEEDAYRYILGLKDEGRPPRDPLRRPAARAEEEPEDGVFPRAEEEPEDGVFPRGEEEPEDGVFPRGEEEPEDGVGEEEPEDGVFLRGEEEEETQHLDVFETTSNGRHGEDSGGRLDPEVGAPSGAQRTGSSRATAHNASVFEPEGVVPAQGDGGGDPCGRQTVQEVTERDGAVERGRHEGEAPTGERKDAALCDGEGWRTEVEKEDETRGHGIEDEENVPKTEEGRERKLMGEREEEDQDEEGDVDMGELTRGGDTGDVMHPDGGAAQQDDRNRGRRELTGGPTASRRAPDGAVHVRGAERGGAPARPAAAESFRDLTTSELHALLFLWILIYCCLIL
ncbi:hypothetical protein EYF80_059135 [Liparis tanakae]|uniref:Uncharacterized protein n=1 Tax=Liparis tanakae TaxID=230148 RepID=A0A4Z2EQZ9_9TELE|nr:hypothetical protein EYF80_059135 [Liparis tanakae]